MSLMRRLWLSVLLAMLVGLLGCFVVSMLTAKSYLEQQLYVQASDSAASLALSMSQQSKDAAMSELLISALFDSGHFESISYRDVAGQVVVERVTAAPAPQAPRWFVALVPLQARAGEALVSDGWRQAGSLRIVASTRYAYASLWQGSLVLAGLFLLVGLLLAALLSWLIRWAGQPLKTMVRQAEAIGERRFETAPESDVLELRVVSRAMNGMVQRLQAMFAEQAARIESLRDEANRDALSGLATRSVFMGELRSALIDERAAPAGAVFVLRVSDLAGVNKRLGRDRADGMIVALGEALRELMQGVTEAAAGRLNGAEMGLLLPATDAAAAQEVASRLAAQFNRFYRQEMTDCMPGGLVGWTCYQHGESVREVMLRVDAAIMQAENAGTPVVGGVVPGQGAVPATGEHWREQIGEAIAERRFELASFPVAGPDGRVLHHEAVLRLATPQGLVSAGQFMPAAARLGLTDRLDLIALELALARLDSQREDIAVNLSPLSLESPGFFDALGAMLAAFPAKASRLWVELSERGLSAEEGYDRVARLAELLGRFGCRLGIEHFGKHFAAIPRLHALHVDYLKIDGSFVAEIDLSDGNRRFVQAVVEVAHSLDIRVIAEKVETQAEWDALSALGVSAATGPAVTRRLAEQAG